VGGSRDDAQIIFTGPSKRGWHRLQLAAECLQKYAWEKESPWAGQQQGISQAPALAKGSLLHLALAQHYARMRARQNGEDEEAWVEPKEAVDLIARLEGVTQFVDMINSVYDDYVRFYEIDEELWHIVAVEELFEATIAGRYLFTGRIDLLIEDRGGQIWSVDHKSSGYIRSRHKEFYAVSGQLIGYSHIVRQAYPDRYGGMKVNLVQVGDKRRFERVTLQRSPFMEQRFEQTVVDIEESIERTKAAGRAFDEWPKAMNEMTCYGRYGPCPFTDKCRWGPKASKAGSWQWVS